MNRRNFMTALGLGTAGLVTSNLIGKEVSNIPKTQITMPFYSKDQLRYVTWENGERSYAFPSFIIKNGKITEYLIPSLYDYKDSKKGIYQCILSTQERYPKAKTIYGVICSATTPEGKHINGVMANVDRIITPEDEEYNQYIKGHI